ncbi:MAG: hypothetical protein HY294_08845 [Candidatus Rokubacteria bacterium]|nr:hypothetical protein [Candidatus Rokubacteria bacterium]
MAGRLEDHLVVLARDLAPREAAIGHAEAHHLHQRLVPGNIRRSGGHARTSSSPEPERAHRRLVVELEQARRAVAGEVAVHPAGPALGGQEHVERGAQATDGPGFEVARSAGKRTLDMYTSDM